MVNANCKRHSNHIKRESDEVNQGEGDIKGKQNSQILQRTKNFVASTDEQTWSKQIKNQMEWTIHNQGNL